jgi:hypothetical protein
MAVLYLIRPNCLDRYRVPGSSVSELAMANSPLAQAMANRYGPLCRVQSRMNMSPQERQATAPWLTQDVPDEHQIVRFR